MKLQQWKLGKKELYISSYELPNGDKFQSISFSRVEAFDILIKAKNKNYGIKLKMTIKVVDLPCFDRLKYNSLEDILQSEEINKIDPLFYLNM